MYPTIILIAMVLFILYSNYLTLTIGRKHYQDKSCVIFDVVHAILPDLRDYHFTVDLIGLIVGISMLFLTDSEFISEFIGKFIIIMFIRAFTILTTILPSDGKCDTSLNIKSFLFGGCFDKIFSGHTSFTLLITLMYYREHIIDLLPLLFINFINIFLIISTHAHYTVDVLLAIFVTTTIHSIKI